MNCWRVCLYGCILCTNYIVIVVATDLHILTEDIILEDVVAYTN